MDYVFPRNISKRWCVYARRHMRVVEVAAAEFFPTVWKMFECDHRPPSNHPVPNSLPPRRACASDAEHASASLPTKPGGTGAASSGVLLPHAIPGEDTPARMLPQEEPNHQVVLQPYQHRQQIEADNGLLFFAPPLPALAPLGPGSFASMHDGNNSDGGRVLLPMEQVRVEPSRKVSERRSRSVSFSVCV